MAETFSCTTDGCVIAVTYAKPTSSPFLFLTVDKMRGDLDQYWEYADLKVNGQSTNVICGSSASQCWDEHLCVSDLDISNYVSPGDTSITVTLDATQWVNALCPLKARLSLQTSTPHPGAVPTPPPTPIPPTPQPTLIHEAWTWRDWMYLGLSFVALILAANQCLKYRQRWLDCIRRMRRYAICRLLFFCCAAPCLCAAQCIALRRLCVRLRQQLRQWKVQKEAEAEAQLRRIAEDARAALAEIATARLEHAQIELDEKVRARESVEEVARGQTEDLRRAIMEINMEELQASEEGRAPDALMVRSADVLRDLRQYFAQRTVEFFVPIKKEPRFTHVCLEGGNEEEEDDDAERKEAEVDGIELVTGDPDDEASVVVAVVAPEEYAKELVRRKAQLSRELDELNKYYAKAIQGAMSDEKAARDELEKATEEVTETDRRECAICYGEIPSNEGLACAMEHFLCNQCFTDSVRTSATSDARHEIIGRQGRIRCCMGTVEEPCPSEPFPDQVVCQHVPPEVRELFFLRRRLVPIDFSSRLSCLTST